MPKLTNINVDDSDVQQTLSKAIEEVEDKEMVPVLSDAAENIKQKAEANAPGSLSQDSLEIVEDDKYGPAALITFTDDKYYGQFPEWGTHLQAEQAFVRGAAHSERRNIEKSVAETLADKLEQV